MTSGFIEEGQHSVEEYRVSLDHGGASGAPTQTRVHQTRDSRKGERSAGQGPSAGPWLEGFRRNRVALAIEASERKERVRDWTWGEGQEEGTTVVQKRKTELVTKAGTKPHTREEHYFHVVCHQGEALGIGIFPRIHPKWRQARGGRERSGSRSRGCRAAPQPRPLPPLLRSLSPSSVLS